MKKSESLDVSEHSKHEDVNGKENILILYSRHSWTIVYEVRSIFHVPNFSALLKNVISSVFAVRNLDLK